MSLMRAFTNRRNKPEITLGRAASQRNGKPVLCAQISSPIALISTSNNLSFDAPDIKKPSQVLHREVSSASSVSFSAATDSDASTSSIHSTDSSTDMSSVDGSSPVLPGPNHLSCYFNPAVETSAASSPMHSPSTSSVSFDAPAVPKRAASHSKKAHESLSRKRSMRLQSPPLSTRSSAEIFGTSRSCPAEVQQDNPFGKELAQLDEVVEEFRNVELEADMSAMELNNLAAFDASVYMREIRDLLNELYGEAPEPALWI